MNRLSGRTRINILAVQLALPQIREGGQTSVGPVAGGHAEVRYAGLHKAWTATRLLAAVSTMGFSLALGRKEKGAATLVVNYGNGAVRTRRLRTRELGNAQRYAALFNGLAGGLAVPSGLTCARCRGYIDSRLEFPDPGAAVVDHVMSVDLGASGIQVSHWGCISPRDEAGYAALAASQDDEDRAFHQAMRDRPRRGHDSTIQTPGVEH